MYYLRKIIRLSIVFLLFSFGTNDADAARGRVFSVGELYQNCLTYTRKGKLGLKTLTKRQIREMTMCAAFIGGFIAGKTATNFMNDSRGPFCLPKRYLQNTGYLVELFIDWARKNKRFADVGAHQGLIHAFMSTAGCLEPRRRKCEKDEW